VVPSHDPSPCLPCTQLPPPAHFKPGTASFADFQQAFKACKVPSTKELIDAFRTLDLDGNGFLTRDEMADWLCKVLSGLCSGATATGSLCACQGENGLSEAELDAAIADADRNRDGKIDYKEVWRLQPACPRSGHVEWPADLVLVAMQFCDMLTSSAERSRRLLSKHVDKDRKGKDGDDKRPRTAPREAENVRLRKGREAVFSSPFSSLADMDQKDQSSSKKGRAAAAAGSTDERPRTSENAAASNKPADIDKSIAKIPKEAAVRPETKDCILVR
jgi:hypothetical protein